MIHLHFNQILNPVGTSRKEDAQVFTGIKHLVGSHLDWFRSLMNEILRNKSQTCDICGPEGCEDNQMKLLIAPKLYQIF